MTVTGDTYASQGDGLQRGRPTTRHTKIARIFVAGTSLCQPRATHLNTSRTRLWLNKQGYPDQTEPHWMSYCTKELPQQSASDFHSGMNVASKPSNRMRYASRLLF